MQLNHITINNFKNIEEASLDFSPSINCLLGNNGMGKSNTLDAIYYLSFARSFSGLTDPQLVKKGSDYMMLQGTYTRKDLTEQLSAGIVNRRRKSFKRGGKEYQRLSDHIGVFPAVLISPADSDLITGTGEERRRFMDLVIAQSDAVYLDHLIRYGRSLQQRNKMLHEGIVDHNLYLAVETAMAMSAHYIAQRRRHWVEELTPIFTDLYARIAGDGETPSITYRTHLSEGTSYELLLDNARRHDEAVGHTSVGPHRDDLELSLNGLPVRRAASQGQCKSFTIALRLAQYEFLHRSAALSPLLLLDDIFDKLDASRVERIVSIVRDHNRFGQIFITDTNRDHLDSIMQLTGANYKMWLVENGVFTPIHHSHETQ
ncbi:MAG: DNA replication and repair protein RecF [Clostridiales bacterium]|nr:DNA replication and repair protein RecF [Clostridiales bacterium]